VEVNGLHDTTQYYFSLLFFFVKINLHFYFAYRLSGL